MEPLDPATLRKSYAGTGLAEGDLAADPVAQFSTWFAEAAEAGIAEPNAMVLSTADADGTPSARTVLLKGYGPEGFRFFTNRGSRKGRAIAANPRVCLLFPWHPIRRQVIVEGVAEPLPREADAEYFATRPHGSRLGAWASEHQSSPITRAELDERYAELAERWPDEVPLPGFWGGHLVRPTAVEFWQGGVNRLHDRLRYTPTKNGEWDIGRLSP